jgi:hypothetical protein
MVFELAIISLVAGAVLGLRSNILILVPAVMLTLLFAMIVGIARAESLWSVALITVTLGFAIQVGYMAGIAISTMIESISALTLRRIHGGRSSWGAAWLHAWPAHTWHASTWQLTPSSVTSVRRSRPPQV